MRSTTALVVGILLFLTVQLNAQETIKSYQSSEIAVYKAEEVTPASSQKTQPGTSHPPKSNESKLPEQQRGSLGYFFGLYQYWVPGTAYTVLDYTNNQRVTKISSGTGVLPGSIKINSDGTYIWNSSWDGKIIKGSWRTTNDSGYPIELIKAQEGKSWRIGKSDQKDVSIIIWDGSTWYNGKKLK